VDVLADAAARAAADAVVAWGPGLPHPDLSWGLWLGGTLVSFAVMETLAIRSGHMDATLSRRLRAWLGIAPRSRWRLAGISLFVGFFAWFVPHIVFGVGA
jgi:hypothetical protein